MATSLIPKSTKAVFSGYAEYLAEESKIGEDVRDHLRACEQTVRELSAMLELIHAPGFKANSERLVADVKEVFESKVRPQVATLMAAIPPGQYFRFYNMFNFTLQRLVFSAAMCHYVATEDILGNREAEKWLGLQSDNTLGAHLELEDYLGGLILQCNELARLATTSVTRGDYERPPRISQFVSTLLAGFRLLNLKNDNLRKKFDSLKYDMKKIEEVVYDLSIRGLTQLQEDKENLEVTKSRIREELKKMVKVIEAQKGERPRKVAEAATESPSNNVVTRRGSIEKKEVVGESPRAARGSPSNNVVTRRGSIEKMEVRGDSFGAAKGSPSNDVVTRRGSVEKREVRGDSFGAAKGSPSKRFETRRGSKEEEFSKQLARMGETLEAEIKLLDAQQKRVDAQQSLVDSLQSGADTKGRHAYAQESLKDAKKQLEDTKQRLSEAPDWWLKRK